MKNPPLVSIILPCYNEAEHLAESIAEIKRVSRSFDFEYEFIFVDDCSKDETVAILKSISESSTHSQFVYHSRNSGRGAAVKTGYSVARGSIVGFIDIDLEISPRYIGEMIAKLDKYDVVIGNRAYFSQFSFNSVMRNFISRSYKRISRIVLRHPFTDTEVGFKFFRKEKVAPFFDNILDNHWFWDTEFMLATNKHGLKVFEYPVEFVRNKRKASTVKLRTDIRKYIHAMYKYKRRK